MVPRAVGKATAATATTVRQRRPSLNPPPFLALGATPSDWGCEDGPTIGLPEPSVLASGRNAIVSAIAPISLLGGTAAVYSAVLSHPSSTLTPLSLFYMILLALQYTLQPRLSRKYISSKTNKRTVALAEETVKTLLAASMFAATGVRNMQHQISGWTWTSSLAVAGLPAVLYAVQAVLQYTAYQYLDPVTFNGLAQTKTLAAAVSCYLILGQRQSSWQMVALGLLTVSAVLFQSGNKNSSSTTQPRCNPLSPASSVSAAEQPKGTSTRRRKRWLVKGVMSCLIATFLSGLAGAFSVRGLQLTGGQGRDASLFTMEVSLFSAAFLLANIWLTTASHHRNNKNKKLISDDSGSTSQQPATTQPDGGFFRGWTRATWVPIVWKAFGGVLTALVHKSSGSVTKGFALMLGLVLSGVLQSSLQEGEILPHQVGGTLLVLLSGWLHFTNPVAAAPI